MRSIYFTVIETVSGNQFEHRVQYDNGQLWGHENLSRDGRCQMNHVAGCICFVNKLFASPKSGTFQYVDNDGDLRHYTWTMEE